MIRFIPQSSLVEGRWRNGQGVSWEIASFRKTFRKGSAVDVSWRFAKARIDNDVPFSIYPGMNRIFMMIEGQGMDLEFDDGKVLQVHEKFVPHAFACDVPLVCKLRGGPSLDLNLFTARGEYRAECEVMNCNGSMDIETKKVEAVIYVLDRTVEVNGTLLQQGDAAFVEGEDSINFKGAGAKVYIGRLFQN
jgi:environmental stress-induced protein Ves